MRFSESGSSPRRAGASGRARAAALGFALAAASPAWGFFNDRLEVFFNETATWDDNVFRVPRGASSPVAGIGGLSDRILTHQVGVSLDLPVSLQRFRASYQHFWTRYDRFDHLDFDGPLWSAEWLWAVAREFSGEVGVSEARGLASFATFRGTERDVMRTRHARANANWQLTPRWLAYGGVVATERTHEIPARRVNDLEAVGTEARLSYVTPKENRVGASVRFEKGRAPESRRFQGVDFDNGYEQVGIGVVGRWDVTAHSRLDGRIDYVKREYDQFSQRDYSGPAWGVTWTWRPTAKLSTETTLRRDIAPLDDVQTSFVLSTGISFKPRWEITEKLALVGSADYATWKYRGDPLIGGDFEHKVRSALVGFAWAPFRRVVFTGSVQREIRTSDVGGGYRTTIGVLDARVGF